MNINQNEYGQLIEVKVALGQLISTKFQY